MDSIYQKIMVGVDDSKQAGLAVEKAIKLAKEFNCKLIIAHVIDEIYFYSARGEVVQLGEDLRPHINQILKDYEKKAFDAGLENVELVTKKGKPKVVLAKDLVEEYGVDLIIMGATGLGAIDRILLGSTSEFVLRRTSSDVLIVR